jgi:hypothetical protein
MVAAGLARRERVSPIRRILGLKTYLGPGGCGSEAQKPCNKVIDLKAVGGPVRNDMLITTRTS